MNERSNADVIATFERLGYANDAGAAARMRSAVGGANKWFRNTLLVLRRRDVGGAAA